MSKRETPQYWADTLNRLDPTLGLTAEDIRDAEKRMRKSHGDFTKDDLERLITPHTEIPGRGGCGGAGDCAA